MDAAGAQNGGWLAVSEIPLGRQYTINQNKWAPLWGWLLITIFAGIAALVTFLLYQSGSGGLAIISLITGLMTLALAFGSVILIIYAIPASLLRRAASRFSVSRESIRLEAKNSRSYPDQIVINSISRIYVGLPGQPERNASNGTIVVGTGLIGSLNVAGAAMGKSVGEAYVQFLSAYNFSVWVNVGGRDIYLARHLKKPQAEYLFDELCRLFKF